MGQTPNFCKIKLAGNSTNAIFSSSHLLHIDLLPKEISELVTGLMSYDLQRFIFRYNTVDPSTMRVMA